MFKTPLLMRGLLPAGHSTEQAILRHMGCTAGNFPAAETGDPTMADPPLDWMLANKKSLGI